MVGKRRKGQNCLDEAFLLGRLATLLRWVEAFSKVARLRSVFPGRNLQKEFNWFIFGDDTCLTRQDIFRVGDARRVRGDAPAARTRDTVFSFIAEGRNVCV